ncbi:50S ribosomal protein L19 [Patescibacteria group bacterium]|nr:50S ribosomal protein L19 [Patescibacteria group bacterium]
MTANKAASAKPVKEKKEVKEENTAIDRTFPDVVPGTVVKISQQITETTPKGEEKKRIQVFEGTVLARKHGKGIGSTITVRKISNGVGVEKIFPLHLPTVKKIEVVKRLKVRRAKLMHLRTSNKRLKEIK